jgi:hypothetical protein
MNPYEAPREELHPSDVIGPEKSPPEDDAVATIIPYKNAPALIAYYLGLFSCFPFLGFFLAIAALILGVKGLKEVKRNPRAHGTAHAWIGLVCGTIGLLFNGLLNLGSVIVIVTALMGKR